MLLWRSSPDCHMSIWFDYYPTCSELELLLMPKNDVGVLPIVQWPVFLLASKVKNRKQL
jgi:hypothetical protein